MKSLRQKNMYNTPIRKFKSLSGLVAWTLWVLIFFAGTVKGNIPQNQFFKATKSAFASANNKASLPSSDSDPLKLPEDSGCYSRIR